MKNRFKILEVILIVLIGLYLYYNASSLNNATPITRDESSDNNKKETKEEVSLSFINPQTYGTINNLSISKQIKLSIIVDDKKTQYTKRLKSGARKAIDDINKQLELKGKDKARIDINYLKSKNIDDQVNLFDVVMGENPSAVSVSSLDGTAFHTQFDIATENNIPIVLCNSNIEDENVRSCVGVDNHAIGTEAADRIIKLGAGGAHILSAYSSDVMPNDKTRQNAFETKLLENPQIINVATAHKNIINEEVSAVSDFTCNDDIKKLNNVKKGYDKEKIKQAESEVTKKTLSDFIVQNILKDNSIKYIYCGDATITGNVLSSLEEIIDGSSDALDYIDSNEAISKIKKCADKIKLVGSISESNQIKYVKEDKIKYALVENPYALGYGTCVAMLRAVSGVGNEAYVNCSYMWASRKNINSFKLKSFIGD